MPEGDEPTEPVTAESQAVQVHLQIEQGIISRMADNCRQCKLWGVTIIAAILFFAARSGAPQHALIALLPLLLLWGLDAYYLAQERAFRMASGRFVKRLHDGDLDQSLLYSWGERVGWQSWLKGVAAIPCTGFYLPLGFTIALLAVLPI